MKWIGKRISVEDSKIKTTFVIYPQQKPLVNALMGAWVAMWLMIGAIVAWSYFEFDYSEKEKVALFVFMTFWTYYAVRVTRSFLWLMWGTEFLKIDDSAFTVKRSIKKFGKATPYYLENIKKIAISIPEQGSIQSVWEASPWVRGGERLEFEYLGKMIRFGRKLDEKDVKLLFNVITKRIEGQIKSKAKL